MVKSLSTLATNEVSNRSHNATKDASAKSAGKSEYMCNMLIILGISKAVSLSIFIF